MTEPAVLPAIAALREEMVTLRRHIHAHPELGFEERRTAALVAECLEAWGYQVSRGVGRTGVVGTLCRGEEHRGVAVVAAGVHYAVHLAGVG
ncbi:hypothetical protein OFL41_31590, partial [Pseudomonas aeruginosa]|nr:hypothetical protein [Pseudomonas aeruginosa]